MEPVAIDPSTRTNLLAAGALAVLVASAGVALAVLVWPRAEPPPLTAAGAAAEDAAAQDAVAEDSRANTRSADVDPPLAEVPLPASTGTLEILAQPAELRVWANTRVRLSVRTSQPFERLIWHFEDGSEPAPSSAAEALVVEHVFAESVRDRHVTVEGIRRGQPPVIATLRLPVERLEVLATDGGERPDAQRLPPARGTRLLLVGGQLAGDQAAQVAAVATDIGAAAVIVAADAASAQRLVDTVDAGALAFAVLHWPLQPQAGELPLTVQRDPGQALSAIRRGERDLGAFALGDLGLCAVDTRAAVIAEAELKRLHDGLQWTSGYRASLLLSARSLTPTRDGEVIADRAYRIYEYALRHQVSAVISAQPGVFYDGRLGGVRVIGVGEAFPLACVRPLGAAACQAGSLSVVDLAEKGPPVLHVLTGAGFQSAMARHALPQEVGKIRR